MARFRARFAFAIACAVGVVCLVGCASRESKLADATTRAVYNDDIDAMTQNFEPQLSKEVTRAQLGQLSDLMHARGEYKGVTQTGTEPDGAYDFRADFSNGSLIVKMKIGADGKISGYRVIPAAS